MTYLTTFVVSRQLEFQVSHVVFLAKFIHLCLLKLLEREGGRVERKGGWEGAVYTSGILVVH